MKRRIAAWVWLLAAVPGPGGASAEPGQVMPPPEPPPIPVKYRNVPPTPPPAESETIPAAATSPASKPPALSMSHDVKQGVEHLRSEREALTKERKDALEELIRDGAGPAERAELRHKITALVARLAANPPARLTSANGEKATPLALPQLPQDLKPADPIGLGRVLFRAKDYEAVLRTFRLLDLEAMNREDRAFVQYLSASCQRLLGKPSEAAALYREVADARGDEFLAECAVWQLGALRWEQEAQAQLEQSRRLRQPR